MKDSDEAVNKPKKLPVGQRSEHSQGEAFCNAFQTGDCIRRNCHLGIGALSVDLTTMGR